MQFLKYSVAASKNFSLCVFKKTPFASYLTQQKLWNGRITEYCFNNRIQSIAEAHTKSNAQEQNAPYSKDSNRKGTRLEISEYKDANKSESDVNKKQKQSNLLKDTEVKLKVKQPNVVKIPEKPTSQELPSPVKRYFLGRFTGYLKTFQKSLANEMPDTFHMFSTFSSGFKEFVIDFRDYTKVLIKLSSPFYGLEELSYRELELYYNMPRQMLKVSPVIIISSLPLAQNIVLPVAYWFPKQLLCYQFWDAKSRVDFSIDFLTKRLYNARPVFRCMQARIEDVEDSKLRDLCQSVFFGLGSGIHPPVEDISAITGLFFRKPFDIGSLNSSHLNGLLRFHNRSVWFFKRRRLREHARLLRCLDKALDSIGISSLTPEQLRNAMLFRGVNPDGMEKAECIKYLEKWISLSKSTSHQSCSLVLHLPILLAYNQPTNLTLIYN